jgi:tetratricopeptide (TPR) repeat protein
MADLPLRDNFKKLIKRLPPRLILGSTVLGALVFGTQGMLPTDVLALTNFVGDTIANALGPHAIPMALAVATNEFQALLRDWANGDQIEQAALEETIEAILKKSNLNQSWTREQFHRDIFPILKSLNLIAFTQIDIFETVQEVVKGNGFLEQIINDLVIEVRLSQEGITESLKQIDQKVENLTYRFTELAADIRPDVPITTRIPQGRTPFLIGRNRLITEITEILKGTPTNSVTITGIPGVGKTEVSVAVTAQLRDHFSGQILWLDCGKQSIYSIQTRIASALGVALNSQDLEIRSDELDRHLKRRPPFLLVLDDIRSKHVESLHLLQPAIPPGAALITSRRDDLPVEYTTLIRIEKLDREESYQVFSEGLTSINFENERGSLEKVLEILDGIPLALFLARHRLNKIIKFQKGNEEPVYRLLEELEARRFEILAHGGSSVRIAFETSFHDLGPDTQVKFARLGVLALNEMTLDIVQKVWDVDEASARAGIHALEDAGLIREIEPDVWWIHSLLQSYTTTLLSEQEQNEQQQTRLLHALYCYEYLNSLHLRSKAEWSTFLKVRPEVTHAAQWLLPQWQLTPELATALGVAIARVGRHYFDTLSLERWYNWALEAAPHSNRTFAIPRLKRALAQLEFDRDDFQSAEIFIKESIAACTSLLEMEQSDDVREAAVYESTISHLVFADFLLAKNDRASAENLYIEQLKVLRLQNYPEAQRSIANILVRLGELQADRGEYEAAVSLFDEGFAIAEMLQDETILTKIRLERLHLPHLRAQISTEQQYKEIIQYYEEVGQRLNKAIVQRRLGDWYRDRFQESAEEDLYRESLSTFEDLNQKRNSALVLKDIGDLLAIRQDYSEAEKYYRESLEDFLTIPDAVQATVVYARLAVALKYQGKAEEAMRAYKEGIPNLQELDASHELAVAMAQWAGVLEQDGNIDEAESNLRRSVYLLEQGNHSLPNVQMELALLLVRKGEYQEAEEFILLAITAYREHGYQNKIELATSRLVEVQRQIAIALFEQNQDSLAEAKYLELLANAKAVSNATITREALGFLGELFLGKRDWNSAGAYYREALAIEPSNYLHAGLAMATAKVVSPEDLILLALRARYGNLDAQNAIKSIAVSMKENSNENVVVQGNALQSIADGVDETEVLATPMPDIFHRILHIVFKVRVWLRTVR